MYSYEWNTKTGGYTLTPQTAKFVASEIRPVYAQELKLVGLDEFFQFNKNETAPICWAKQNVYIYRGEEIAKLEGFGEKSVENLNNSIIKSKDADPISLLFSLCIPKIGKDAAKRLVEALGFKGFIERINDRATLENIDKIGPERAGSIIEFFNDERRKSEFTELLSILNVKDEGPKDMSGGELRGLTFVITGDVNVYKNRDEFKAYVESQGGAVTGSVSKKTNYLVNNDVESTSSKNMKAKELGIPIISEAEFIERFDKGRSL